MNYKTLLFKAEIFKQSTELKPEDFTYFNDRYTNLARLALNITDKSPPNLSIEGKLSNGQSVRLLSSTQARELGLTHRLQIKCLHCHKWISTGTMNQHNIIHLKGKDNVLSKEKSLISKIKSLHIQIRETHDPKEQSSLYSILADVYDEMGNMSMANYFRRISAITIAQYYAHQEYGHDFSIHSVSPNDGGLYNSAYPTSFTVELRSKKNQYGPLFKAQLIINTDGTLNKIYYLSRELPYK